ncbi:hypothetical protein BDP27DRAFT_1374770 [Rhodocollybia butyracea]|uniref:Uncharacterized protein n=1 Tax=Rhodocollybia butyracea TaxID=206335 RepID=A0A9P5TVA9_9AGAR|nr:hypothetical protein BDP27DRAFT_1374770 [Rhodocollybia butyracea]
MPCLPIELDNGPRPVGWARQPWPPSVHPPSLPTSTHRRTLETAASPGLQVAGGPPRAEEKQVTYHLKGVCLSGLPRFFVPEPTKYPRRLKSRRRTTGLISPLLVGREVIKMAWKTHDFRTSTNFLNQFRRQGSHRVVSADLGAAVSSIQVWVELLRDMDLSRNHSDVWFHIWTAKGLLSGTYGGILSFGPEGDAVTASKFVDSLKPGYNLANAAGDMSCTPLVVKPVKDLFEACLYLVGNGLETKLKLPSHQSTATIWLAALAFLHPSRANPGILDFKDIGGKRENGQYVRPENVCVKKLWKASYVMANIENNIEDLDNKVEDVEIEDIEIENIENKMDVDVGAIL